MTKFKYGVPAILLLAGLVLGACGESTPTAFPTTVTVTMAATSAAVPTSSASATAPLPALTTATVSAPAPKVDLVEPKAGSWKTWLLTSGSQFRLKAPPDKAASEAEIKQLKDLASKRDAAALDLIAWWDTGGPSYRWNELAANYALKNNLGSNLASRDLALLHTTLYDGLVAAWDTKYTYNRPRPSELDPSLTTLVPNPHSPAYPSEYAVTAGAGAAILSYIFPDDAAFFARQAEDATRSRLLAGVDYPSDITAGLELGRQVATLAIERGKTDGSDAKWTGTVPTEPGKWNGTNPVLPLAGTWKPWVLSSPSEFRPGPPPAYDSAQEQAELAELKAMQAKRTPKIMSDAFFWEYAVGGPRGYYYWSEQTSRKLLEYHLDTNPVRAARAYALTNIAIYEGYLACWDAKYTYWAPRPFMVDKEFKPLFTSPNHPSYPAAHGCVSTSVTATLSYLFPRDAPTFKEWGEQAAESRMWAGIHFRSDVTAGVTLGKNVSQKLIERAKNDGSQA